MVSATIEDIWESMENDTVIDTKSFILKRRLNPQSLFDIFLAMEKPKNKRILLLEISASNIPNTDSLPQSKGFELHTLSRPENSEDRVNLELSLTNSEYSDIFSSLAKDIIDQIDEQKNEVSLIKAFIERIIKWQYFLERYGTEGLNDRAQRGLYGELWFLREYQINILGKNKGVESWKGPYGKAQDFQFSDCAIEVKTSIGKQHQNIHISNEQQLDDTGFKKLYLHHLSLIESPERNGETLFEIVDDIRKIVASDPMANRKMDETLIKAGYLDVHSDRYNEISYTIKSSNIFRVTGNFPRIIEKNILNGVGDIRYSISLAECMHYVMDESDFKMIIGESI